MFHQPTYWTLSWRLVMSRAYYQSRISDFFTASCNEIIGRIAQNHPQSLEHLQTGAWKQQVEILQRQLSNFHFLDEHCSIFFELLIPRMGRRADVVIVLRGIIFVVEFKVGASRFHSTDVKQAHGYAIDLKNFHQASHDKRIIPVLLATDAFLTNDLSITFADDDVAEPVLLNQRQLVSFFDFACTHFSAESFDPFVWLRSGYKPTPSIVEAAQALYADHDVQDISRSDAGAKNIAQTSNALFKIIRHSRIHKQKSICFVTGVPGAGKTLVGLNIATQHSNPNDDEHAVFLSGNGPLVDVLREALARDESTRNEGLTKASAHRRASQFIQNIHHFRDEALNSDLAPVENVVIFDEAQRAWDKLQTSKFMKQKRGLKNFDQSEPEFLIEVMDRHEDWCVVIALIGGGQEINTGEAGIQAWLDAMAEKFPSWYLYYSPELNTNNFMARQLDFNNIRTALIANEELHLSTSMRSFRSENLAEMVHHVVAGDAVLANQVYQKFSHLFPIFITRSLTAAKQWINKHSRATETKGLIASSGAVRLKPSGVFVKNRFNAREWFLNGDTDIRSCHYLEDTATEFDIQGLELDWCLVGWDADYRYINGQFEHWQFVGANWQQRHKPEKQRYLENAYRVLLTRARQGMVIFIPHGEDSDLTRKKAFYDETFQYLMDCGFRKF